MTTLTNTLNTFFTYMNKVCKKHNDSFVNVPYILIQEEEVKSYREDLFPIGFTIRCDIEYFKNELGKTEMRVSVGNRLDNLSSSLVRSIISNEINYFNLSILDRGCSSPYELYLRAELETLESIKYNKSALLAYLEYLTSCLLLTDLSPDLLNRRKIILNYLALLS